MQIPFEFDHPKKNEESSLKSKESDLSFTGGDHIPLQEKKALTVTQLTKQITFLLEGKFRSLAVE